MKKLLLISAIFMLINLPSYAATTPDEILSKEYTVNQGYSTEMARLMNLQNAQVNGQKFDDTISSKKWYETNKCFIPIRKIFTYLDPALDTGEFMQHDIHYTPTCDDL